MKILRKNVQNFKTYMLNEQAKHTLTKHNANLSPKSDEFEYGKRIHAHRASKAFISKAQCKPFN